MTPARDGRLRAGVRTSVSTRCSCCSRFAIFRTAARRWPVRSRLISISCCCLCFFGKRYGGLGARGLAGSLAKMAVCAAAMAAMSYAALRFANFAAVRHLLAQAGLLAAMIGVSVAVYFGLAWLLRCEELSEFLLLLRRAGAGSAPSAKPGCRALLGSWFWRQGSGSASSDFSELSAGREGSVGQYASRPIAAIWRNLWRLPRKRGLETADVRREHVVDFLASLYRQKPRQPVGGAASRDHPAFFPLFA